MTEDKFMFFSGKGGVGKTTMAASAAVEKARSGLKTLIVTTDPAANLSDIYEQEIGHKETKIEGVENLYAMEIDPDKATEDYRERIIAPMRGVMPDDVIEVVEEQFNSPCTTEIAAFDRFVDYMEEDAGYDFVVFDTAPTGHTIRLLELPVDWSKHIEESAKGGGQTCIGPVESIKSSQEKYDRATEMLRNNNATDFVFVVQPEETPIEEAERSAKELGKIGIDASFIIVNGILPAEECTHPFFKKRKEMQDKYLEIIENKFNVEKRYMELLDDEVSGLDSLKFIGKKIFSDSEREAV